MKSHDNINFIVLEMINVNDSSDIFYVCATMAA